MANDWASIANKAMKSPRMKKCAADIGWINGMTIPELIRTIEQFSSQLEGSVDAVDVRVICTDDYGNLRAYYSVPMAAEEEAAGETSKG